MKRKILLVASAAMLMLAIFLLANFRLALARTNSKASTEVYTLGVETGQVPPRAPASALHVDAGWLPARPFQRALQERYEKDPVFGTMTVANELNQTADQALLHVRVKPTLVVWTPIFTWTRLEVDTAYSYEGDLTWYYDDKQMVEMTTSPSADMHNGAEINDVSFGLISWPGYLGHLGKLAAGELDKAVTSHLR